MKKYNYKIHLLFILIPYNKKNYLGALVKKLSAALIPFLFCGSLSAFENGQLSLTIPSQLEENDATFAIRHRFFGEADDVETLFGSDLGGNMGFYFRYAPLKDIILNVSRVKTNTEYNYGIAYAMHSDVGHAQVGINAFQYKLPTEADQRRNTFANVALQSTNLMEFLVLTSNIGYDGYNEKVGAGFGVDFNFANMFPVGLTFTERVSFVAEYYPRLEEKEGITGKNDAYTAGVKFQTFNHHFEILVSNSTAMDARNLMLGTNSDDVHFGFNINRRF